MMVSLQGPTTPINGLAPRPSRATSCCFQLSYARGTAKSGRTPHGPQRDSHPLGLLGLPDRIQRLSMEHGTLPASVAEKTITSSSGETYRYLAIGLMVASGFAALSYQIVWTQQSALWLGHEAAAVLAVLAGFFGGLATGALMLGPRIDRSTKPTHWYAVCEAVIGVWSLGLAFLMAPVSGWLLDLIGAQPTPVWQWTVAFCGTFLLLLPATAAMGATLPAMERILAGMRHRRDTYRRAVRGQYLWRRAGSPCYCVLVDPGMGPDAHCRRVRGAEFSMCRNGVETLCRTCERRPATGQSDASGVLILLAATGLLGIGYEVLVVRVLSQIAENTVYTFAILLAVYLVGTALGAAVYQRWLSNSSESDRLRDRLLHALAAACLLGTASLGGAAIIKTTVLRVLGPSMASALAAEAMLAATA